MLIHTGLWYQNLYYMPVRRQSLVNRTFRCRVTQDHNHNGRTWIGCLDKSQSPNKHGTWSHHFCQPQSPYCTKKATNPKMASQESSGLEAIPTINKDNFKLDVYIRAEIHVLLCIGSSIEAVWIVINTLTTSYLVWICLSATRLLQVSFKCQAS